MSHNNKNARSGCLGMDDHNRNARSDRLKMGDSGKGYPLSPFGEALMDIKFGETIAVGGARYCLVFVDRATRYNWVFALETFSASDICDAFNLFCAHASWFAECFCADCDDKLLGLTIKLHLTESVSDIVGAVAGRQPSNGLVESH